MAPDVTGMAQYRQRLGLRAQAPAAPDVAQMADMDTLVLDESCMADLAARGRCSLAGHGSAAAMERCENGPGAASSTSTGTHST